MAGLVFVATAESCGVSSVEDVDRLTAGSSSNGSHALSVEGTIWLGLVAVFECPDALSETLTVVAEGILTLTITVYVILVPKYHQDWFRKDRRQLELGVK